MTFVLALLAMSAYGQVQNSNISPKINSPLSRFGLGNAVPQYFVATAGMGGLSAAWQDPYHLNTQNPASLAYLQATSFEGALSAKNTKLTGRTGEANTWSGNLQYLALGFPLRNAINKALDRERDTWNAGMSIALLPYSQVGYDVRLVDSLSAGVDVSTNVLKGAGGTNRLRWGTGFRYKQLSVGVDVGFMFGKIINSRLVTFDSLPNALAAEFEDNLNFKGATLTLGAQYTYDFKKPGKDGVSQVPNGKRFILGGTLSNETDLREEGTQFARRYLGSVVSDTIFRSEIVSGTTTLPMSYSFGLHYQHVNHVNIGVEYGATAWSNYRNTLKAENLADTYYVAVGGEYIPKYDSYNNYLARVRYRAGFRYETDPRTLDGQQIKGYALTFGMGLPVILPRQQVSFINMAVELGRSGVAGILEEDYVRLSLGFTLNDNSWFFKRKFN